MNTPEKRNAIMLIEDLHFLSVALSRTSMLANFITRHDAFDAMVERTSVRNVKEPLSALAQSCKDMSDTIDQLREQYSAAIRNEA